MLIVNLGLDKSKLNPYISTTLINKIEENIKSGKKSILYLNKRGKYSSLICQDCQYIYKCNFCDVSMNVHKSPEKLACHLCGYTSSIPLSCKKCKGTNLLKVGVGTQQIEESLKKYFKNAKIFRFDLDSIKNKNDKQKALENLENSEIIIGTKMITTGFDFKKVGLIAIVLIEQEISIPSYNTEEKAYINIKQMLGRGQRAGEKTDFIIQSFIPDNETINGLIKYNYKDFLLYSLEERKLFNYPPFCEMAYLEYRDLSNQKAKDFIENLKNKLDLINNGNYEIILNKSPRKKYNQYHYKIIIKGNNLREFLSKVKMEIIRNSKLSSIFE